MTAAKRVTVTIPAGQVVYIDGRSYGPGEQVKVTIEEAKAITDAAVQP